MGRTLWLARTEEHARPGRTPEVSDESGGPFLNRNEVSNRFRDSGSIRRLVAGRPYLRRRVEHVEWNMPFSDC